MDAETLTTSDSAFSLLAQNLLTTEQSSTLTTLRESFDGRLNIPFLEYLGFNLRESFSTSTAMSVRSDFGASAYSSLTSEAVNILSLFTESNVVITGSIEAVGESFIPVEACAFLQFSRVEFGKMEVQMCSVLTLKILSLLRRLVSLYHLQIVTSSLEIRPVVGKCMLFVIMARKE